jgi:hypothetical protein
MQVADKESMQLALTEEAAQLRVAHGEQVASLRLAIVEVENRWQSEAAHEREQVRHDCNWVLV